MSSLRVASRHAFSDFLERVQAASAELDFAHHERPWYRGHSRASHQLLPSLFRANVAKGACPPDAVAQPQDVLRLEGDLFFEFQARLGREHLDNHSAWDILFLMRHYGLPTRSLDWTEVLGVAVYFALSGSCDPGADPPKTPSATTTTSSLTSEPARSPLTSPLQSAPKFCLTDRLVPGSAGSGG